MQLRATLSDLRGDIRWLSSGYLLTLCSGFGQTYFIAIYAGYLKADLEITDGHFGMLYTAGTLASAFLLMWVGKLADIVPIRWLGAGVLLGTAAMSLVMAAVAAPWALAFAILGLRFFGQGLSPHIAMTAMGRWFSRKRGRAVAIAALGFPTAEALLPIIAVTLIAGIGWRTSWIVSAALLALLAVPAFIAVLKRERVPSSDTPAETDRDLTRRHWTRGEVLRSPLFYGLLVGVLTQPFILTALFFAQVNIVETKGWNLTLLAASYPVMAGASVLSALITGWQVDRVGARQLLPAFLVPIVLACLVLALTTSPIALPVFMALVGISLGSGNTINGAVWAEIYGTDHLGAIRAVAMAAMVFASALSPTLIGLMLDAGVMLETLLFGMAIWTSAAAALLVTLMPRLRRVAAERITVLGTVG